jgi:hypothetical protein
MLAPRRLSASSTTRVMLARVAIGAIDQYDPFE